MTPLRKQLPKIILGFSFIIGLILRFYNLDWGDGYFFNPDEYHIIGAVGRLTENGLFTNPKLFSYGSFTVYIIYFAQFLTGKMFPGHHLNLFIIGRFLSAVFSALTLINIYFISKTIFRKTRYFSEFTVLLSAFVPGLVQQAHFLTPETFMTFWITFSTLFLIKYFEKRNYYLLILSGIFMGIAGGTKISAFAALPFMTIIITFGTAKKNTILASFRNCLVFILSVLLFFFVTFPYSLLDYRDFKTTTRYESSLSIGRQKVFYTRAFEGASPFIFQTTNIYPFTLGISLSISGFLGLMIILKIIILDRKVNVNYRVLSGMFLSYFLFNSLLFTKWTRFIHPTIPYLIIFSLVGIFKLTENIVSQNLKTILKQFFILFILISTVLWSLMYYSIHILPDVRKTATIWVNGNIPKGSVILTETGNTLEVPLNGNYRIIPFDFYNVDSDLNLYTNLIDNIYDSEYFIIQSRRIYLNHNKGLYYPVVNKFYNSLFNGKMGFEIINTFSSFPQLKIGEFHIFVNDEYLSEETWSVFDHPVIKIFKKTKSYEKAYYEQLLGQ